MGILSFPELEISKYCNSIGKCHLQKRGGNKLGMICAKLSLSSASYLGTFPKWPVRQMLYILKLRPTQPSLVEQRPGLSLAIYLSVKDRKQYQLIVLDDLALINIIAIKNGYKHSNDGMWEERSIWKIVCCVCIHFVQTNIQ